MPNKNLTKAKAAKNDEFYTQLSDIEKELCHYRDFFRGKVVFCNCDDPEYSNFWKYFQMNFIGRDVLRLNRSQGQYYLLIQLMECCSNEWLTPQRGTRKLPTA